MLTPLTPWFEGLLEDVQPRKYTLQDDICMIGRSEKCQIVVPRGLVSRLHAKIEPYGPRYMLHDVQSANGTYVNGQRIRQRHLLADGDVIGLGPEKKVLRFVDLQATIIALPLLRMDARQLHFQLGDKPLKIRGGQFRLLSHLYNHAGELCSRESCAEAIWGDEYKNNPELDTEALDKAMHRLRRKLREVKPDVNLIETVRGRRGFILNL